MSDKSLKRTTERENSDSDDDDDDDIWDAMDVVTSSSKRKRLDKSKDKLSQKLKVSVQPDDQWITEAGV